MTLLIVFGVTLAVLGSVMWVMPSKRDQMIIAMRQKAMQQGIRVRVVDQALAKKWIPWVEDYRPLVIYELQRSKVLDSSPPGVIRLNEDALPRSVFADESAAAKLDKYLTSSQKKALPPESQAIYLGAEFVALIWKENGGEESAEQVCILMHQLAGK